MRADYPRRSTSALIWLVSTLVAAFVLQLVLLSPTLQPTGVSAVRFLTLSIPGLKDWQGWTLATHALIHDPGQPLHFLCLIAGLIVVGRELEPLLGSRRFIAAFAGAILLGGLSWTAVHWTLGGTQFGASAGLSAFLVILTCLQPRQEVTVFPFPVSCRLRPLVYGFLAVDLLALGFYEIQGAKVPLELNPSAHLGGMLAGWLYSRFLHAPAGWDRAADFSAAGWRQVAPGPRAPASPAPGQPRPPAALRAEVDLILDKINSHGFGSLSDEEKRTLDEAKDLLSKH